MRYEGKCLDFRASIGLLPLILIILQNETLFVEGLKEIRVDVNEI